MPLKKYIFSLAYSAVLQKTLGIIPGRICIFNKYQQKGKKKSIQHRKRGHKVFSSSKMQALSQPSSFLVIYRQYNNGTQRALTELSEFLQVKMMTPYTSFLLQGIGCQDKDWGIPPVSHPTPQGTQRLVPIYTVINPYLCHKSQIQTLLYSESKYHLP